MSYQQGKNRLYPRYSLNSSDNEDTPIHRSIYAQPYNAQQQQQQQQQQQSIQQQQQVNTNTIGYTNYRTGKNVVGLGSGSTVVATGHHQQTTTTPVSDNGSSATLTDAEAALARDNTLLVNNGRCQRITPLILLNPDDSQANKGVRYGVQRLSGHI
ncbi:epidermal growth factor receptor substrate 15 homolog [Culex quinquefasciatus]|uniref:epidermal growth factor receptor substrate 15 homolog n=1 Tax=Culex quinquefasciatus TaxID=7176 RepID=UPI0018E2ABC3|nr:epidermal growth factor receptor substrate 15 homolog [Culex quinquefasciatus]